MNILTKSERRWSALALIVTAQFMVVLDVAIVNVALPSIKSDLHFSETNLQWVISAYAILIGGALLLGGRLADLCERLLCRRRDRRVGLARLEPLAADVVPVTVVEADAVARLRRRRIRPLLGNRGAIVLSLELSQR